MWRRVMYKKTFKLLLLHCKYARGGTNREYLCRGGYWVRKLISGPGPGRVYRMRLDKSPQYFQPCLREYAEL